MTTDYLPQHPHFTDMTLRVPKSLQNLPKIARTHKSNDIQAAPPNDHHRQTSSLWLYTFLSSIWRAELANIRDAYFFILRYVRGFLQCPQLQSHLKSPQLVWRLLKCQRIIHSRQKLKVSLPGLKIPKSLQEAVVANCCSFFYKPFPIRIHCDFLVQIECSWVSIIWHLSFGFIFSCPKVLYKLQ